MTGVRNRFRRDAEQLPPGNPYDNDWQGWIENRVERLSKLGWTLEMLATRRPLIGEDFLPPDCKGKDPWCLEMDCRGWADLFIRYAGLAEYSLHGKDADLARHGVLALRTQCHPSNDRFLLRSEALLSEMNRPTH